MNSLPVVACIQAAPIQLLEMPIGTSVKMTAKIRRASNLSRIRSSNASMVALLVTRYGSGGHFLQDGFYGKYAR
jgi:hypothetical protein